MNIGEKARALHDDKSLRLNCAQAALCALAPETGLDEEAAKLVSSCFGGGARSGELCGAVCGALMAVGMAVGDGNGKPEGKVAPVAKQLTADFKEKFGAVRCAELVASHGGKEHCGDFISYAAQLAAAVIDEENNKTTHTINKE